MMTEDSSDELIVRLRKENLVLTKKVERTERNMQQLQFLSDNNSRLLQGVMIELEAEKARLERALNDLREAQERLVQAEKMASLGQLTAGIAHEIRNPLNFVNNFAEVSLQLCKELGEAVGVGDARELRELAGDLRGNLERIHRNGERAAQIVGAMLELAGPTGGRPAPADLNELLVDSFDIAYSNFRADNEEVDVRLEKNLAEDLEPIGVIRTDLTRVFVNLYNNALDAVLQRARDEGPSFAPVIAVTTRSAGDWIEIEVRDNGPGIPAEIRSKIFDPFFTTKKGTSGSGLGLSVSYDIVTGAHHGQIDVESEPGMFTAFRIRLPKVVSTAPVFTKP
jgi:signal transduction histidine kinase